eukprot:130500-Rhodomonas_salina.1
MKAQVTRSINSDLGRPAEWISESKVANRAKSCDIRSVTQVTVWYSGVQPRHPNGSRHDCYYYSM